MQRTPMKRSAWPRRLPPTEKQVVKSASNTPLAPVEYAHTAIKKIAKSRAVMAKIGDLPPTPIPKANPVRSEEYRRLVAALPCFTCGIQGYSQAAHVPPDGKGLKQDDREIFPLCCARVGVPGCHADFDQYRMYPSDQARDIGLFWASITRAEIEEAGLWPKNLEKMA